MGLKGLKLLHTATLSMLFKTRYAHLVLPENITKNYQDCIYSIRQKRECNTCTGLTQYIKYYK